MSDFSQIPVQEFLDKVKARGVRLRVNDGRIRIGWPEKNPDQEIRQAIIDRKPEILETLRNDFVGLTFLDHLTEMEREYYFNLLEIMQSPKFGMDREAAEREAEVIVAEYRLRKKQRVCKAG